MAHREVGLVGPVFDERHDEHHRKDRDENEREESEIDEEGAVARLVFERSRLRNLRVAEVEAVGALQNPHSEGRGNHHRDREHGALAEVRDRAHHDGVEFGRDHVVLTGDRNRNAEVREGEEEGEHEGRHEGAEGRTKRRLVEGTQKSVPHHPRDHDEAAVNVREGVVKNQEGGRKRVDDVRDQKAGEAVDRERRLSYELAHEPHAPEGVHHGETVGDGREEKRQKKNDLHALLQAPVDVREGEAVGRKEGDHGRKEGGEPRHEEASAEKREEFRVRENLRPVLQTDLPVLAEEGLPENRADGKDQRHQKEGGDQNEPASISADADACLFHFRTPSYAAAARGAAALGGVRPERDEAKSRKMLSRLIVSCERMKRSTNSFAGVRIMRSGVSNCAM